MFRHTLRDHQADDRPVNDDTGARAREIAVGDRVEAFDSLTQERLRVGTVIEVAGDIRVQWDESGVRRWLAWGTRDRTWRAVARVLASQEVDRG